MTFSNEQTTARMSQLFEQARRFFTLEKEYLTLNGVEILTRLFSTIALAAILILVGFLVILFGSFSLAYWIGNLLDSQVLGFAIIAGALLLGAALVWLNRMSWIVEPTIRFMVHLLAAHIVYPTLEGLDVEKKHLENQLIENQEDMTKTAREVLAPAPEPRNGWESATNLIQNGMTIFHGIQIGLSVVAAARSIFGIGRKRRR